MKYTNLLISTLLLTSLLYACQQNTGENRETVSSESSVVPMIDAKFVCTDISQEDSIPKSMVSFYLNGKVQTLDTINACQLISEEEYERYGIPVTAASAVGGWWAGAGDYFYAMVEGNVCTVMQGWQDEQQEDDGFHYEQIRRFVITEK